MTFDDEAMPIYFVANRLRQALEEAFPELPHDTVYNHARAAAYTVCLALQEVKLARFGGSLPGDLHHYYDAVTL